MAHDKKNIMLILSSPSGVGKTTLTKKIQQKYQNFKLSVSHTTRKPRSNEVNGIDYFFVKEKEYSPQYYKNEVYLNVAEKYCWSVPSPCSNTIYEIKKKNGFIFFKR